VGLLKRARDRGVHCLAVTDHETLEGAEACVARSAAVKIVRNAMPGR
jgi:predicted metal-dependent phosphoesterase TrpH